MAELARTIVSRLRAFIGNRRHARRRPARLPCVVTIAERRFKSNGRAPSIEGFTRDLSSSGLGLAVPAIRIGEHYLVGDNRRLHVAVELPIETIQMLVTPVRYESLEDDETDIGYVIGVIIVEMSEHDREQYQNYVRRLLTQAPPD
jgi:PilZ domain